MKPAFKRVALVGKQTPEIAQSLRALRELLRQRGCEVLIEKETAASVGADGPAGSKSAGYDEIGRGADLAIVVGGDGTMLAAARNLARHKVPLAGINQGRLGFMTDIALTEMVDGDRLRLKRSADNVRFVHPPGYRYFATLREKLRWSEVIDKARVG